MRPILLLLLLVLLPLWMTTARAEETSRLKSSHLRLEITGLNSSQQRNLEGYLTPLPKSVPERSSYLFTLEDKATEALQALGYYQARFDTRIERGEKQWQVTMAVTAGERLVYDKVAIRILGEAATDKAFDLRLEDLGIKPGDPVHHGRYDDLKSGLLTLGLTRGYFDGAMAESRIEVDRENYLANLVITYDSGRRYLMGDVEFWASEIKPELLEAMVPFEPGSPYHSDKVTKLSGALLASGYFKDVKVLPHPDRAKDNRVPVEAGLTPPASHSVDFGVGYATDTETRVSVTWRTPVINSSGHSQSTTLKFSRINPELSFDYRIPYGHPLHDQLLFRASLAQEEYGDIDSNVIGVQFGRNTLLNNNWTRHYYLRYLREDWKQRSLEPTAQYLIPGLSFAKTRRKGPPLDPSYGFRQLYRLEHATTVTGSDQSFVRATGALRYITTLTPGHRISTRGEFGINTISDDELLSLAPSLRFFAGGDQSIRGFGYQRLGPSTTIEDDEGNIQSLVVGGRYLLVGSFEYQYYLRDNWRVATFVDGGNAFDSKDSKDIDLVYSVGAGVHWISPVGPIRFDVGYGISEEDPSLRLHITIGAEL